MKKHMVLKRIHRIETEYYEVKWRNNDLEFEYYRETSICIELTHFEGAIHKLLSNGDYESDIMSWE